MKKTILVPALLFSCVGFGSEALISHLLHFSSFKPGSCGHAYLSTKAKRKLTFLTAYQTYKKNQKELMKLFPLTSNELEAVNYNLAKIVKLTLENDGFKTGDIVKVKSQTEVGGQTVGSRDFYVPILSAPEGSRMQNVLLRLQKTNPQLKFYYIVDSMGRANGAYSDYRRTIYLNPDHIYLDNGDYTNTFLHEITHSHRYKLIEQGVTSLLNASIRSSQAAPVTTVPGYTNYMSFQELATFTKDYHLLKTGRIKNINALSSEVDPSLKPLTVEQVIEQKKTRAITIARNIQHIILNQQEQFDRAVDFFKTKTLDKHPKDSPQYKAAKATADAFFTLQTDPLSDNRWMVKFPYVSGETNLGEFQVWLPELKLTNEIASDPMMSGDTLTSQKLNPTDLSESDRTQVLNMISNQLKQIKLEAMTYENSLD